MKTPRLLLLSAVGLWRSTQSAKAQTLVNKEWEVFNGIPDSIAYSASALDGQGDLIVTSNAITADADGKMKWLKVDDGGQGESKPSDVEIDNAGNVYMSGSSSDGTNIKNSVTKYTNYEVPFSMHYNTSGKPNSNLIVYTTDFFNGNVPDTASFRWFSGTSASCPHVAGTAALLLSYVNQPNPDYNNLVHEDVEYILQRTADDDSIYLGYDDYLGFGKLNAGRALDLLKKPLRYVRHFDTEVFPSVKNATFEGLTNIHLNETIENPNTGGSLFSGNYQADVYKITATVTHNLAANESIYLDYYWARPSGSTTVTRPDTSANPFDVSPHERAYITNINDNTAEIVGYAYKIYLGSTHIWLPYDPITQLDSFQLAYSILVQDMDALGLAPRNESNLHIRLYPNPTTESHTVDISSTQDDQVRITCYNAQGQNIGLVYEGKIHPGNNIIELPTKHLASGFYFYQIQTAQGIANQRFIKN